jgi:hypothetical protein
MLYAWTWTFFFEGKLGLGLGLGLVETGDSRSRIVRARLASERS